LKSSHIGISLSQAEASIAAPFTSLNTTIACVPTVIKEGRAALSTSFQMFLWMGCYSMIQFFGVILLYDINSTFGDYQVSNIHWINY
jgi:cation-transporting ATPase 13A2